MKATNFKEIHKRYKGKWVALTTDERSVISSGNTAKEVYDKAHKKGFEEPILMKVPPEVSIFVGIVKIKD